MNLAKDVPNLHAHKFTNYITTVYYLYKIAYLQKKNPSKSITEIMNSDSAKGAVIDLANLSYINKAINIICTKQIKDSDGIVSIPSAYTGTNAAANNRALRVLGMALHVAGDAFSHKSIVPNSDDMKSKLKANVIGEGGKNIFTKDEYKKIIDKLDAYTSTTGMTYSALDDNVAASGRKKKSHENYADNPGSSGRRYTHGAKVVVTGLLKDYYYRHNKFDHNVFNNFGSVSDGKNNICMFRIYTYARKIDTSIVTNSTTTWRLFSRCD